MQGGINNRKLTGMSGCRVADTGFVLPKVDFEDDSYSPRLSHGEDVRHRQYRKITGLG